MSIRAHPSNGRLPANHDAIRSLGSDELVASVPHDAPLHFALNSDLLWHNKQQQGDQDNGEMVDVLVGISNVLSQNVSDVSAITSQGV